MECHCCIVMETQEMETEAEVVKIAGRLSIRPEALV